MERCCVAYGRCDVAIAILKSFAVGLPVLFLLLGVVFATSAVAAEQGDIGDWLSKATRFLGGVTGFQVSDGSESGSGGGGGSVSPVDYCTLLSDRANVAFGTTCGDAKYDYVGDVNKDSYVNVNDLSRIANLDDAACEELYSSTVNPCLSGVADLAVTSFEAVPFEVKVGEWVTINYKVSNKGSADSGSYTLSFILGDGIAPITLPQTAMKQGEYISGSFSYQYTNPGTYTVTAAVSSSSPDSDTLNNKASVVVKVVSPPGSIDVNVTEILFSHSSPKAGDTVKFSAIVKNAGTTVASDVSVYNGITCTYVDGGFTSGATPQNGISIQPGGSYTYEFSQKFDTAADCTVSVSASVAGDTNPSNNKLSKPFKVSAASPNLQPGAITDELKVIAKNDYFVVVGSSGKYTFRYIGALSSKESSPYIELRDVATGSSFHLDYKVRAGEPGTGEEDAALKYSGSVFRIWNASADTSANFNLRIDLNGDGKLSGSVPQNACTDSDGGISLYEKGTTVGLAADDVLTTRVDSCWPHNYYGDGYDYVAEWYCWTSPTYGKTYAINTNEKCPNGCKDGACAAPSQACQAATVAASLSKQSFKRGEWVKVTVKTLDANRKPVSSRVNIITKKLVDGAWKSISGGGIKTSEDGVWSDDQLYDYEPGSYLMHYYAVNDDLTDCANGGQADVTFTISGGSASSGSAPVIVSAEVPQKLMVGETSAFTWRAEDADGDSLVWGVDWGDGTVEAQVCKTPEKSATATSAAAVQSNVKTSASSGSSTGSSGGGGGGGGSSVKDSWTLKTTHAFSKPGQYTVKVSAEECGGSGSSGMASVSYVVSVSASGVVNRGCTDSDGGKNYYVTSVVSTVDRGSYNDRCVISQAQPDPRKSYYVSKNGVYYFDVQDCSGSNCHIAESYCDSTTKQFSPDEFFDVQKCPSGCSDGACITEIVSKPIYPIEEIPPQVEKLPPDVPEEGFDASVTIEKGWNLVGFSLFNSRIRENTCKNNDVLAAYGYDSSARKYFSLIDGGKSQSLDMASGVWLKMAGQCSIAYTLQEPYGWTDGRKLAKGWNFISVVPDMVGSRLEDFSGDCEVMSAYAFDSRGRKWDDVASSVFGSGDVGGGIVVGVSGDCALGFADAIPPPLPPEVRI